jgi:hypothetical protein
MRFDGGASEVPLKSAWILALAVASCGDNLTPLPAGVPYGDTSLPPLTCVPNLDGKIDANELEPAPGVPVRYRVTPSGQTREVSLEGAITADGKRVWDFAQNPEADAEVSIQAEALSTQWFAEFFPEGQIVTPIDAGATVLGVYEQDSEGFWLHGLASSEEQPEEGQTLLVYSEPILLYRFPIAVGQSWVSAGKVNNGILRGLPYAATDTYEIDVTSSGVLLLPNLEFQQVFRVNTKTTIQAAVGGSVVTRQSSFLFECFGEVARATSQTGETEADFGLAAEVRRLSL